jgi:hypothetical protein
VEKTYDRSIERFIQVYQKRGRQIIQETRS